MIRHECQICQFEEQYKLESGYNFVDKNPSKEFSLVYDIKPEFVLKTKIQQSILTYNEEMEETIPVKQQSTLQGAATNYKTEL